MAFTIGYSDKLGRAPIPVIRLAHEAVNAIVQAGHTGARACVAPDEENIVIYAKSEHGDPIGILLYTIAEAYGTIHLDIGYVEPSSRQDGVYRAMFLDLVHRAKEKKLYSIRSMIHVNNRVMLDLAQRDGFKPTIAELVYDVP